MLKVARDIRYMDSLDFPFNKIWMMNLSELENLDEKVRWNLLQSIS